MTDPVDTATRLRQILGQSPDFERQPGLTAALANSSADPVTVRRSGALVSALETAKTVGLAREGGSTLLLSDRERALLGSVNATADDVDQTAVDQLANAQLQAARKLAGKPVHEPSRGFFGSILHGIGSGASFLVHNPVSSAVFHGLDRASDIVQTPLRLGLASAGSVFNPFTGKTTFSDHAVVTLEDNIDTMKAKGYDPNSFWDVLGYFSHGQQVYDDMTDLRSKYGDVRIDQAKRFLEDPKSFTDTSHMSDQQLQDFLLATKSKEWKKIVADVDSRHFSAGRTLARALDIEPGTKTFTVVSGATDGLVSWYADPTLILGKAHAVSKVLRYGLESITDEAGVRKAMTNTQIRRGWQAFLDDAKTTREGDATEQAAAFARLRARTPELVPLLGEINGRRLVKSRRLPGGATRDIYRNGAPIENLDDLTQYLVDQNGLTRVLTGKTMGSHPLMPGAVSRFGVRQLRATTAGALAKRGAARGAKVGLDSSAPWRYIATTGNAYAPAETFGKQVLSYRRYGVAGGRTGLGKIGGIRGGALSIQSARARLAYTSKRLTSLLPDRNLNAIEYDDPRAVEMVRRFAGVYLPNFEANRVASVFANSSLAGKRQVYKGLMETVIHASGLTASTSGQKIAERIRRDNVLFNNEMYSLVPGAGQIVDDAGVRYAAILPGQVNRAMYFPSFGQLQKAAASVSLYDFTLRKPLSSGLMDNLTRTLQLGWLVTGGTMMREVIEDLANGGIRGITLKTLQGRGALSRHRNYQLAMVEIPEVKRSLLAAKEKSPALLIKNGQPVQPVEMTKLAARRRYWSLRVQSTLHRVVGTALKPIAPAAMEQYADELAEHMDGNLFHAFEGLGDHSPYGVIDPRGQQSAREIAEAGYRPASVGYKLDGYKGISPDGEVGARAWVANLNQRFDDTGLGFKILRMVEGNPKMWRKQAVDHVLKSPLMADARDELEMLKPLADKTLTDVQRRGIASDYVDMLVRDYRSLLTDKHGDVIKRLTKRIRNAGEVPSIDWIERKIPHDIRPPQVIGRSWVAVPRKEGNGAYANLLARGYSFFVTKPAAFLSRQPMYMANYAIARHHLEGYEDKLVDQFRADVRTQYKGSFKGLTGPALRARLDEFHGALGRANKSARDATIQLAHQHAYDRTVHMVDNPNVQSHLSVVSRNFFNFERAAEDWIRRWSTTIIENPASLRKLQLAYEAGIHSGVIQYEQGTPMIVYPGSGAAINAVLGAGEALGIPGMVKLPTVPNLRSQVIYLNPSLDKPLPTVSPVVSTPVKALGAFFPESSIGFAQLDQAMHGQLGAGRAWYKSFMPSVVNRFIAPLSTDDANSQMASAAKNTIVALDAAGKGIAADATAPERDAYIQRIRIGARNQIMARSVFAFFLPASPELPQEDLAGDDAKADNVFRAAGVSSLKDEFRQLVAQRGYQSALQIWTAVHPDELAYTVSTTTTGSDAPVDPTFGVLKFIQDHKPVFDKYTTVAGYFIPNMAGDFDQAAWNAELEMGLRKHKDLNQFYRDVRITDAEREYFKNRDLRDSLLNEQTALGNDDGKRLVNEAWQIWSGLYLSGNPLLAEKLVQGGTRSIEAKQSIQELRALVIDPHAKKLPTSLTAVQQLLDVWDAHDAFTNAMRFQRTKEADAQKAAEQTLYAQAGRQIVAAHPELTDLYNGVFRDLN